MGAGGGAGSPITLENPLGPNATGVGATTEVAAMATFALGYLTRSNAVLAVMLATITMVVLALKPRIHHFARAGMTEKEINAGLSFLVISFVVLPLLPSRYIDPWNLINPSRLWLLFVLMAGISFAGYIAVRLMGAERGVAAAGFFAGFVSSTAATMSLAQKSREGTGAPRSLAVAIVLANVASLTAQAAIVGASSPTLFPAALPVLMAPILIGAVAAWIAVRMHGQEGETGLAFENPLQLKSTAKFALVLGAVLVIASAAAQYFGTAGILATALVVGATDVHAVTLAVATLVTGGNLPVPDAVLAITIALSANMAVKLFLAGWTGGRRLLILVGPPLVAMVAAAMVALLVAPMLRG